MSVNKSDLIAIRPGNMNDKSFIFATWLRGLKYGNDWFDLIESEAYFKTYQTVITGILSRPDTVVRVACLKEDPEVILGYSVYAADKDAWKLEFVFVKKSWRGIGIAKSIVPLPLSIVTHLTTVGRSIMRKYPHIKFNPFANS